MVGFAAAGAGALGGAALRTTMVIGARLGAIRQFGQLRGAMQSTQGSFLRTGLSVLNLVGNLALLGGVMRAIFSPITGLVAAGGMALVIRNFVGFEQATRRARMAMEGAGIATRDQERMMRVLNNTLSRSNQRALMENQEAWAAFQKMFQGDEGLTTQILELSEAYAGLASMDHGSLLEIMLKAQDGDLDAMRELHQIVSGKNLAPGESLPESMDTVVEAMAAMNEQIDKVNYTNFEHTKENLKEIDDAWEPILGKTQDFLALITTRPISAVAEWFLVDVVAGSIDAAGRLFHEAFMDGGAGHIAFTTALDMIGAGIKGQFEKIPDIWRDAWPDIQQRWDNEILPALQHFDFMGIETNIRFAKGWITSLANILGPMFDPIGQYLTEIIPWSAIGNWIGETIWDPLVHWFKTKWAVIAGWWNSISSKRGLGWMGTMPGAGYGAYGAGSGSGLVCVDMLPGSGQQDMTEGFNINVYVGQEKIDALVTDSLGRIHETQGSSSYDYQYGTAGQGDT